MSDEVTKAHADRHIEPDLALQAEFKATKARKINMPREYDPRPGGVMIHWHPWPKIGKDTT